MLLVYEADKQDIGVWWIDFDHCDVTKLDKLTPKRETEDDGVATGMENFILVCFIYLQLFILNIKFKNLISLSLIYKINLY